MSPAMKPEFDYGDYPPERVAYDAWLGLNDYLACIDMPEDKRAQMEDLRDWLEEQIRD